MHERSSSTTMPEKERTSSTTKTPTSQQNNHQKNDREYHYSIRDNLGESYLDKKIDHHRNFYNYASKKQKDGFREFKEQIFGKFGQVENSTKQFEIDIAAGNTNAPLNKSHNNIKGIQNSDSRLSKNKSTMIGKARLSEDYTPTTPSTIIYL